MIGTVRGGMLLAIAALTLCGLGRQAPAAPAPGARPSILSRGGAPFPDHWLRIQSRGKSSSAGAAGIRSLLHRSAHSRAFSGGTALGARAFLPPVPERRLTPSAMIKGADRREVLEAAGDSALRRTPPDSSLAVGAEHVVHMVRGLVTVYNRSGMRLGTATTESFFALAAGGLTYPRGEVLEPRVLWDRATERWFASGLEYGDPVTGESHVLLAVSRDGDATGAWDKYLIPVGDLPSADGSVHVTHWGSLGIDSRGVYVGADLYTSSPTGEVTGVYSKIAATSKASLTGGRPYLSPVYQFGPLTDMLSPSPAHTMEFDDPGDAGEPGPEWIVGVFSTLDLAVTDGDIRARQLSWRAGVPVLSDPSVLPTGPYASPIPAPANGSATPVDAGYHVLQSPVVRSGRLWTCRGVAVDASGESAGADRNGCEWLELDVTGAAPTLVQQGRVFDTSPVDPHHFYFPTIMVTGQGHAVMGYTGSSRTAYISAFASGRLATDPPGTMGAVTLLHPGQGPYELLRVSGALTDNRWGHYGGIALDPADDMTVWTGQPYAEVPGDEGVWGTWIASLIAPAPTLQDPQAVVRAGQGTASVTLNGTGFFDPDLTVPQGLQVYFPGGATSGISNIDAVAESPARVVVTFSVSADATPGARDIVVVNPDGQTARVTNGLTVLAAPRGRIQVAERVDFGRVRAGRTRTRMLTIRNAGLAEDLQVNLAELLAPFEVENGGETLILAPGGTVDVALAFTPTRRRRYTTQLEIRSSDPERPLVRVRLAGSGR